MKLSYAITVKDELDEIKALIEFLLFYKEEEDEIVVLWDNRGDARVMEYLNSLNNPSVLIDSDAFENHFADWKNRLSTLCTGDYIINIDADELPSTLFVEGIVELLNDNPDIDMFIVPRWNTVKGITEEHVAKWRWNIDELNRINWPDYQMRVYKNVDHIEWINPVHEVLTGYLTFAPLPDYMYFNHHKTIERQEKQNKFYNSI